MFNEGVVHNPSHYAQHKFEAIDEMVIVFGLKSVIEFCKCNAWKYRNRAPYKDNFEDDNAKADWYLTKAKELQEKTERKTYSEENISADTYLKRVCVSDLECDEEGFICVR